MCPSNIVMSTKSIADTFDICSKCRKGRGPYLFSQSSSDRDASRWNYVRFLTFFKNFPNETTGKHSWAFELYFHVNIVRIRAAGYFKLIFEINISSGIVAHPSSLSLLPFYFDILFAFNVHGFGSEPSDTMSKTSQNIIM